MSRQPLTNKEWFDRAERGTSGDQVHDILYDWKANLIELQARNAELNKKLLANTLRELAGIPALEDKITELQAVVDRLADKEALVGASLNKDGFQDFSKWVQEDFAARIELASKHATPERMIAHHKV